MTDLNLLFEFSRNHCIAICAFLVPANLLATSQTMLFVWFRRPLAQIYGMASIASVYALLLFLHVLTWLAIGVVMAPTYILTFLSCVCWIVNCTCILFALHQRNYQRNQLVEVQK